MAMTKVQMTLINKIANDFNVQATFIDKGRIRFTVKDKSHIDIYPSMYVRRTYGQQSYYSGKVEQYQLNGKKLFDNLTEQLKYVYNFMQKNSAKYANV